MRRRGRSMGRRCLRLLARRSFRSRKVEIRTKVKVPALAAKNAASTGHPLVFRTFLFFVHLAYFFAPGFQVLLYLGHELVGYRAIDQAVIVAQSEMDDGADGDGVAAIFVGDD